MVPPIAQKEIETSKIYGNQSVLNSRVCHLHLKSKKGPIWSLSLQQKKNLQADFPKILRQAHLCCRELIHILLHVSSRCRGTLICLLFYNAIIIAWTWQQKLKNKKIPAVTTTLIIYNNLASNILWRNKVHKFCFLHCSSSKYIIIPTGIVVYNPKYITKFTLWESCSIVSFLSVLKNFSFEVVMIFSWKIYHVIFYSEISKKHFFYFSQVFFPKKKFGIIPKNMATIFLIWLLKLVLSK